LGPRPPSSSPGSAQWNPFNPRPQPFRRPWQRAPLPLPQDGGPRSLAPRSPWSSAARGPHALAAEPSWPARAAAGAKVEVPRYGSLGNSLKDLKGVETLPNQVSRSPKNHFHDLFPQHTSDFPAVLRTPGKGWNSMPGRAYRPQAQAPPYGVHRPRTNLAQHWPGLPARRPSQWPTQAGAHTKYGSLGLGHLNIKSVETIPDQVTKSLSLEPISVLLTYPYKCG
jgi:hypothetical protein